MNLAIKGHKERGKEVIEILEMLGGKRNVCTGIDNMRYYVIDIDNKLITPLALPDNVHTKLLYSVFTLEQFLEKFPYKVGDKVIINDLKEDIYTISDMYWDGNNIIYNLRDKDGCLHVNEWLANEMLPYKEQEIMEETIKIDIPKGYKFAGVDDDNQQVVFEKIKLEYPKTYEECCNVLKIPNDERYIDIDVPLDYNKLLSAFTKLLICRDAYWKIAGGWKPDFVKGVYSCTIRTKSNKVIKDCGFDSDNSILAFPTEEMRDNFYENFKDLIEECKELL